MIRLATDLAAWKKRTQEKSGAVQDQHRQKKPKISTAVISAEEIKRQLAAHRALMSGQPLPSTSAAVAPSSYGVPPPSFGMAQSFEQPPQQFAQPFVPPPFGMPPSFGFPASPFGLPPGYAVSSIPFVDVKLMSTMNNNIG
jgi:hypothetical protein